MNIFAVLILCLVPLAESSGGDKAEAFAASVKFEKMGTYEDAVGALLPIYKLDPKDYRVNLRLGWLYYLWGKNANSIRHYEQACKTGRKSLEAMLGLSLPLMAQHRWEEAERLLNRVLKTDRYNYYGNLRLAYVLRMQSKFGPALKAAEKMLELYPCDTSFLLESGLAQLGLDNCTAAVKTFHVVLLLDPQNATAKQGLKNRE